MHKELKLFTITYIIIYNEIIKILKLILKYYILYHEFIHMLT